MADLAYRGIHSTTRNQARLRLVIIFAETCGVSETARRWGTSRQLFRKWLTRFQAEGLAGDRRSSSRTSPFLVPVRQQDPRSLSSACQENLAGGQCHHHDEAGPTGSQVLALVTQGAALAVFTAPMLNLTLGVASGVCLGHGARAQHHGHLDVGPGEPLPGHWTVLHALWHVDG
jgi:transposase-like protein